VSEFVQALWGGFVVGAMMGMCIGMVMGYKLGRDDQ